MIFKDKKDIISRKKTDLDLDAMSNPDLMETAAAAAAVAAAAADALPPQEGMEEEEKSFREKLKVLEQEYENKHGVNPARGGDPSHPAFAFARRARTNRWLPPRTSPVVMPGSQ